MPVVIDTRLIILTLGRNGFTLGNTCYHLSRTYPATIHGRPGFRRIHPSNRRSNSLCINS